MIDGLQVHTAEHLRRDFEQSFRLPPARQAEGRRDFVLVDLGARQVALSIAGLRSIERVPGVVAVPTGVPALVGLAGLRGRVLPVFRLATLLGHPGKMNAHWWRRPVFALAEMPGGRLAGLAFDRLERFVRAEAEQVRSGQLGVSLQVDDEQFALVDAVALLASLATPTAAGNVAAGSLTGQDGGDRNR